MKIKNKRVIIIICIIVFIIMIALVCALNISKKRYINVDNIELKTFSKADYEGYDIDKIIDENSKDVISEEISTEEIDLEYTTIYKNNDSLAKGKIQVLQEGRDGKQTVVNKKIYKNGELVSEEQTGRVVTQSSIDKIIEVGTSSVASAHKLKKGDKVYVTSYTLNLMQDKDRFSNKITTLEKDAEVKIIEVSEDGWVKISYKSYTGWVDSNCVIYKEIEPSQVASGGMTKEQLLASLNENMKLNKPSGLSLEQFKKILSGDKNDTNKVFEKNAEYFYYIEKQYNVNGVFVAAVGIHESAWGTSKISMDKKNLFGYGASDSNPYNNAYTFANYSEGIDLLARVFVKYYINPSGTKIYDNETATGRYYSGSTIADVNKKYATDKNWHNSVYKWMGYLYNRL